VVAHLHAERTRWDEQSDLFWWADVITYAQARLGSMAMQPLAQELLAIASPFIKVA
jgi:hypothetical protein